MKNNPTDRRFVCNDWLKRRHHVNLACPEFFGVQNLVLYVGFWSNISNWLWWWWWWSLRRVRSDENEWPASGEELPILVCGGDLQPKHKRKHPASLKTTAQTLLISPVWLCRVRNTAIEKHFCYLGRIAGNPCNASLLARIWMAHIGNRMVALS